MGTSLPSPTGDASTTSRVGPMSEGQASIRLLKTPSAESVTLDFAPSTTIGEMAVHLLANWPENFPDGDKVTTPEVIKFLFKGKFLEASQSLASLGVTSAKPATFHVMIRANAAKAKSKSSSPKTVSSSHANRAGQQPPQQQSACCTIL